MPHPPTRAFQVSSAFDEDTTVIAALRREDIDRVLTPVATVKAQLAAAQPGRHRRTRRRWWRR